jgi:hypothetical protein
MGYLRVSEAAKKLGRTPQQIYSYLDNGMAYIDGPDDQPLVDEDDAYAWDHEHGPPKDAVTTVESEGVEPADEDEDAGDDDDDTEEEDDDEDEDAEDDDDEEDDGEEEEDDDD